MTYLVEGTSGPLAHASNGSVDFDWKPGQGSLVAAVFVRPTRTGTVTVLRVDQVGVEHTLLPAYAVTAAGTDDDNGIQINVPVSGGLRLRYTNTDSNAGTVTFDVASCGG